MLTIKSILLVDILQSSNNFLLEPIKLFIIERSVLTEFVNTRKVLRVPRRDYHVIVQLNLLRAH